MTEAEYKEKYDKLLTVGHISKEMLAHLQQWALNLIKSGNDKDAEDKMTEYAYRAFVGDMRTFEGFQFFSFRDFSSYSLKDIENDKLSLSHPEKFNDPLDTVLFAYLQRKIKIEKDIAKSSQYCMLLRAAHQLRMRCFVRSTPLIKKDGSLGVKRQNISDVNSLMWAHYANYHKGFCAKYELDDKFVKCDEMKKTFTRMAILHYEKNIDISKNLAVEDALLWKNAIWEYEKEVRVIDYDPDGINEFREQDAPPLKAIYLGVKCSDKDRHDMQLALRRKSVELYQMHIDSNDICSLTAERIG
ncbi:Protein of unknown function [Prevotella sp. khp7]|uniref:DUF2971 domain-containing protein n=1 Tax=Prevotella sp. khp7 TaxID=1761885 RepID=UPI0008C41FFE|nr:DUF2971 domain-containing protein [Prevotella sp. khp7]SEW23438.1 Protein of unknown function [Prevotella sp. khp7]